MTQQPPEKSLNEILSELEKRLDFFTSEGYQDWVKSVEEQLRIDKMNAPTVFKTNDEWQKFRGHCDLAERIIRMEDLTRHNIDLIQEEIREAEAAEAEANEQETPL
jgi:hypothetical protein